MTDLPINEPELDLIDELARVHQEARWAKQLYDELELVAIALLVE